MRKCVASALGLSLLMWTAACVASESMPEQPLLDAFEKIDVMHADYRQVIDNGVLIARFEGPILFVKDANGGQFQVPLEFSIDEQEHAGQALEMLYANGTLRIIYRSTESPRVQESVLDPTHIAPPGGPLFFSGVRESYDLTVEFQEGTATVHGVLKEGSKPIVAYGAFDAEFDLETGLLEKLEWKDGPEGAFATVTYSNPDFDPDWDPNRLIFDPPLGAEVAEQP